MRFASCPISKYITQRCAYDVVRPTDSCGFSLGDQSSTSSDGVLMLHFEASGIVLPWPPERSILPDAATERF